MPDTSLAAVVNDKKAYAEAVLAKLGEVREMIADKPDLWFGGLPAVLVQVDQAMVYNANQIRTAFKLDAPADTGVSA